MNKAEFSIPVNPEDLLLLGQGPFAVKQKLVFDDNDESKLKDIIADLSDALQGHEKVLNITKSKFFDLLFSICAQDAKVPEECKSGLFELLRQITATLNRAVRGYFENPSRDSDDHQEMLLSLRNAMKIVVYCFTLVIRAEEQNASNRDSNKTGVTSPAPKAKGKKKGANVQLYSWDSEEVKEQCIASLVGVLELDLGALWSLEMPEDEFSQLFSKIALLMLERPSNAKSGLVKRALASLFAPLAKKYGQSYSMTISMINSVLCKHEHSVIPLAELMEQFVKDHELSLVVGEALREVGKMGRNLQRDTQAAKNVASFMTEVASRVPEVVLPATTSLLSLLDGDPYSLRNGVVQVLGQLIQSAFEEAPGEAGDTNFRARDSLIRVLLDRFRDVQAFTRSKVCQVWADLAKARKIPIKFYAEVSKNAVARLQDKSVFVRRAAMNLVSELIAFNPYGPQLTLKTYKDNLKASAVVVTQSSGKTVDELLNASEEELEERSEEELKHLKLIRYFMDSIGFIQLIHSAIPSIVQLMGSKTQQEVLEAFGSLEVAYQFKVSEAERGIKQMLTLIWSKEEPIRNAIIETYLRLFLSSPPAELDQKLEALYYAKNLAKLTMDTNVGELTSLEELIGLLARSKRMPRGVIESLWELFARKDDSSKDFKESRGALMILTMAASSDPSIIRHRLQLVVQEGLGERARHDPLTAKWACIALQKLASVPKAVSKADSTSPKTPVITTPKKSEEAFKVERFNADHVVFERLSDFLKAKSIAPALWFPGAEQAISAIYAIADNPDKILGAVIRTLSKPLFNDDENSQVASNKVEEGAPTQATQSKIKESSTDSLSKLLFIVGQTALKQLVYIEDIFKELKRRRIGANKSKSKKGDDDAMEAIEKELGTAAMTAEQQEEKAQLKAEKDVIAHNLLGMFGPVITAVCSNVGGKYTDPLLRSSAVLALSKFMCVSPEFCEKNLNLLFTILEGADNASLRANIIITLGDLSFRFPNLVHPYASKISKRLRDRDIRVRKNTLMVLSHLILNDMVKSSGQIADIAFCLVDAESRIADLARLFFHELSCKDQNAIYNILPDTISTLSNAVVERESDAPDSLTKFTQEQFKEIMSYLLTFTKDAQVESLVGKLCQRLKEKGEVVARRNLSYCILELNLNEKHVKRLTESFKLYKDALVDAEVFENFNAVIAKIRKSVKTDEQKNLLDELEQKVLNHRSDVDDSGVNNKVKATGISRRAVNKKAVAEEEAATRAELQAQVASPPKPKRGARAGASKPAPRKKTKKEESSDEEEEVSQPKKVAATRAPPARTSRSKKILKDDSDEDDAVNAGLEELEKKEAAKALTKPRGAKRKLDDENEDPGDNEVSDEEEEGPKKKGKIAPPPTKKAKK